MTTNVISSTITVPLIVMTPAVPARKSIYFLLGGDVGKEHETEGEVDEVHRLDQADDREEPRDHASLRLGLARDTTDERVAREAVAESGADGAQPDGEAERDEGAGENKSVICHLILLMMLVF